MSLITQRFTVHGRGAFPFDMLRYDACYPVLDATALARYDQRAIVMEGVHERGWEPTVQRWRSFGWSVEPVLRGYEDEVVSFVQEVL
jgi:hypothetical protein